MQSRMNIIHSWPKVLAILVGIFGVSESVFRPKSSFGLLPIFEDGDGYPEPEFRGSKQFTGEICKENKIYPDPTSRDKFYLCRYNSSYRVWIAYAFTCPKHSIFNNAVQKCQFESAPKPVFPIARKSTTTRKPPQPPKLFPYMPFSSEEIIKSEDPDTSLQSLEPFPDPLLRTPSWAEENLFNRNVTSRPIYISTNFNNNNSLKHENNPRILLRSLATTIETLAASIQTLANALQKSVLTLGGLIQGIEQRENATLFATTIYPIESSTTLLPIMSEEFSNKNQTTSENLLENDNLNGEGTVATFTHFQTTTSRISTINPTTMISRIPVKVISASTPLIESTVPTTTRVSNDAELKFGEGSMSNSEDENLLSGDLSTTQVSTAQFLKNNIPTDEVDFNNKNSKKRRTTVRPYGFPFPPLFSTVSTISKNKLSGKDAASIPFITFRPDPEELSIYNEFLKAPIRGTTTVEPIEEENNTDDEDDPLGFSFGQNFKGSFWTTKAPVTTRNAVDSKNGIGSVSQVKYSVMTPTIQNDFFPVLRPVNLPETLKEVASGRTNSRRPRFR